MINANIVTESGINVPITESQVIPGYIGVPLIFVIVNMQEM